MGKHHRRNPARIPLLRPALLLVGAGLGACGGSGGSDPGTVPPPPVAQVEVTGKATFDLVGQQDTGSGLDYADIVEAPIRGARVQALGETGDAVLAESVTDAVGDYRLTVQANTRLRVRVRAQLRRVGSPSWDVQVVDNTAGDAVYVLDSAGFDSGASGAVRDLHAASGWNGSSYAGVRSAAPFAMLDAVTQAMDKVVSVDPDAVFPALVIKWSPDNVPLDGNASAGQIGTTFYRRDSTGAQIFVLGAQDNDTDEYDRHVIIHEWGHYFEDAFSRADSVGGPHSAGDRLDPRVSFSEGWGYAYAGMATDDPITRDSAGSGQQQGFIIDVDRNANANPGWYSEGSMQSILYDLYDADPDGVDAVALGFGPLYEVFVAEQRQTRLLTTIFSFVPALKAAQPALAGAIDDIVAAQGIRAVDMDALGSTETNNAGNLLDVLPVYSRITVGGPAVNVCSIGGAGSFGTFNKLSNRRFLSLDVPAPGRYRIVARGPGDADPDVAVYQAGFRAIFESERPGVEDSTLADAGDPSPPPLDLVSGEAVIEVYEFTNVVPSPGARGRTCFDVTVTRL